jgi:UDP-N-acetyl-2-amino-2-deoxyglucuronate dehydrogenase
MKQVRFGIIGTGMIAEFHANAISKCQSAVLTTAYDIVAERAKEFSEKYNLRPESSLESFLAGEDIDAVIISTPSGAHMEPAISAAKAGKHVLCEKPMEVTLKRADCIINACEKNNVKLGCIFQARTGKNVKKIQDALQQGRFGRLILAGVQLKWFRSQEYYDSAGWRGTWRLDGGGALMNQSVHIIDLLRLFAGPARRV